ncbi:MAG: RnfABCDGE type electron transport complex subunit C, partial [Firmicutes bacterium]|nr:RnfABCDGE type electron transport complex subunit C [Bacillota bacterium]
MGQQGKHLNSIHVSHEKHTAACATEIMPIPETVCISMSQHIGAPCKPLVAKGDAVKVGQIIGDTDAFVSAPIHSSVSGTVKDIITMRNVMGGKDQMVVIEADGKQEVWEEIKPPVINDMKDFIAAMRASGLVGLGGASFPTHIKLNPKNLDEVETLIVNAAECEPFITSDHRLMLENTQYIIDGVLAVMKYLDIKMAYIGVEENKPDAIEKLNAVIKENGHENDIKVHVLRARYPQGAERVMIYEITGKTMNAGELPAQYGIVLSNVTTFAFIGQYLKTGRPLTTKRITVDGNAIAEPKNIIVPIGTRLADVAAACGGYKAEPKKIIMGGPMMGRAVYSDEFPLVKNNNAILFFDGPQALIPEETGCIKCGMCTRACSFDLLPVSMVEAYENKDADKLNKLKVMQ